MFRIIGEIVEVETIAAGRAIRERRRLIKSYGTGYWRKRRGIAQVKMQNGETRLAELHSYEATGIGLKEFKIKRFLD